MAVGRFAWTALVAAASLAASVLPCLAGAVFDPLDSAGGWTLPIYQYGIKETGDATIADGELRITHAPVGRYHTVSAERAFVVDACPSLWLHFRFREQQQLLGANMYTLIWLGDTHVVQFGVNGEQHWRMFARCEEKQWDDELFFGSPIIAGEEGGKNTDMRVALPEALAGRIRYTDYHVFSVGIDLAGDERRVGLHVDGWELPYRDIDSAAPAGAIDTRIADSFRPPEGPMAVKVSLGIMTDGDLYSDTSVNGGEGIRWLRAFADMTPALPHPETPSLAEKRDSVMLWDWVMLVPEGSADDVAPAVRGMVERGEMAADTTARLGLLHAG